MPWLHVEPVSCPVCGFSRGLASLPTTEAPHRLVRGGLSLSVGSPHTQQSSRGSTGLETSLLWPFAEAFRMTLTSGQWTWGHEVLWITGVSGTYTRSYFLSTDHVLTTLLSGWLLRSLLLFILRGGSSVHVTVEKPDIPIHTRSTAPLFQLLLKSVHWLLGSSTLNSGFPPPPATLPGLETRPHWPLGPDLLPSPAPASWTLPLRETQQQLMNSSCSFPPMGPEALLPLLHPRSLAFLAWVTPPALPPGRRHGLPACTPCTGCSAHPSVLVAGCLWSCPWPGWPQRALPGKGYVCCVQATKMTLSEDGKSSTGFEFS